MAVRRRALLASLAAAGTVGTVSRIRPSQGQTPETSLYLSAGASVDSRHHVAAFDESGRMAFAHALPARGHAVAVSPDGRTAVMCARRAGRFAIVVDLSTGTVVREIAAAGDRHFYGHAAFSADGSRLFATENAYTVGEGRIGLYDTADGFRRIGEWPSHGIGPHELRLMPDGRTLVVANGGILTHPDSGREKLNLDTMAPAVVFMDARDGSLIDRIAVPQALHQLSTRHLAVGGDGAIAVVMQYEGPETDQPPLIGLIDTPGRMRLVSAPEPIQLGMANYCGSVAFDSERRVFGVSSPRGGLFTFWHLDGALLASVTVADGCGIAADGRAGGFVLSSGLGGLWRYHVPSQDLRQLSAVREPVAQWDNHLTAVSAR